MTTTATVARDVGRILQVVSLMLVASLLVSLLVGEYFAVPAYVASTLVMAGIGTWLVRRYPDAQPPTKREAMITAATAWAVLAILGALPFLLIAWTIVLNPFPAWANTPALNETTAVFRLPINGIFESISGFTSTGLTMAAVEDDLPQSLHWWRSFTEWVGGVGVIVLTVAILARPGSGSLTLFEAEAREVKSKVRPSILSTVREIWTIYLGFTAAAIGLLVAVGMPLWPAINHAMTGIATGGFSVHADSIGAYGPLIQYAVVPIMVAGSIAFPIHYLILKGEIRNLYQDIQTRWVFLWFTAGTVILTAILYANGQYDTFEETFRIGLFQFVSATSNTGFGTATIGGGTEVAWSAGATLFVCLGMLTGAAAGSTVGGLKLIRVLTLLKGTAWHINSLFLPATTVRRLRMGQRTLDEAQAEREYTEATVVFVLWIVCLIVGIGVLLWALPSGYPLEYVIFDVVSAQSNVGLDAGITGPLMPDPAKAMLMVNMWIGRLEIIPVAVLIGAGLRYFNLYT